MAQPPKYTQNYDYSDELTTTQVPGNHGAHLDTEFAELKATTDSIIDNLALLQRDDGLLANNTVGLDQLQDDIVLGLNRAEDWVTAEAYAVNDVVYFSNIIYRCLVAHTSGVFATDLAASKWAELVDFDQFVDAASASASAASDSAAAALASEVAAGLSEDAAAAAALAADASADAAALSATSINLPLSLTGKALNLLRVNAGETGYEHRTATQVRGDIGATATGDALFTAASAAEARTAISVPSTSETQWYAKAVGEVFYLRDDLAGVTTPPTNNADYRYIKLTASDAYNTGVLTSESVTGSAPLVVATAVISLVGSPINGLIVNLINTERRVIRAGSSGTVEQDAMQNFTGSVATVMTGSGGTVADGVLQRAQNTAGTATGNSDRFYSTITIDLSRQARTATETRGKNIGATAYMRIK